MKTTLSTTLRRPLAVATLLLAGAMAVQAQTGPGPGAGPGYGPMMGGGMGPGMGAGRGQGPGQGPGWSQGAGHGWGMGGMMWRALDRVNATPEQRTKIQQIMQRSRAEMQAQHEAGRALRDQALALFAQPTIDAAAAEALRQKQMAQHDAASKRMLQSMLDVSQVLTPEQRKQMSEYLQQRREMMQRHWRERQGLEGPKS